MAGSLPELLGWRTPVAPDLGTAVVAAAEHTEVEARTVAVAEVGIVVEAGTVVAVVEHHLAMLGNRVVAELGVEEHI